MMILRKQILVIYFFILFFYYRSICIIDDGASRRRARFRARHADHSTDEKQSDFLSLRTLESEFI